MSKISFDEVSNAVRIPLNISGDQSSKSLPTVWGSADTVSPSKVVASSFFNPISIDTTRWNGLFPYRLLVVKETSAGSGQYQVVTNPTKASKPDGSNILFTAETDKGLGRLNLSFSYEFNAWEYRLPITPQQLSISTVFTANSEATLQGIVEQHGGIKFKIIQMAGSFGVLPFRDSLNKISPATSPFDLASNARSLFGGTINAAQGVVNSAIGSVNSILNGYPKAPPKAKAPNGATTGYAQALLLDQFLEQYSEAKRNPANSNWRLALDIPKQNQTFLVTPLQFAYMQSVDSPNEYKFNLQLKAWRRINISFGDTSAAQLSPISLSTSAIQRGLQALNQLQSTVYGLYSVVSSVRSDILTLDNAVKSTAIFCKQAIGLPTAFADLPDSIQKDLQSPIADYVATNSSILQTSFRNPNLFKNVASQQKKNEGVSYEAANSGQLGNSNQFISSQTTDPLTNLTNNYTNLNFSNFPNPASASGLPSSSGANDIISAYQTINISDLNLNQAQLQTVTDYENSISLYTVDDIIQNLQVIQDVEFKLSNIFAGGDPEYNQIYGKPPPSSRSYPMTDDEYAILQTFYDTEQFLQGLTATNELNSRNITDTYTYVQSLAQASNIPFQDASSKVRYPVPFGLTIEEISGRYLGDPNRWNEIATLNNLAEPYIDEAGFFYPMLTNPLGRDLNVGQVDNLFIGQPLEIVATGQPTLRSTITKIEKIAPNNYIVTIEDTFALGAYTTANNAKIHAYLPATVNSMNFIWVPTQEQVPDTFVTRPIPSTQNDALTTLSKIDLLLTDQLDIAIDQFGNFKLAYGMSNLLQALKVKLSTVQGSLISHPTFGAAVPVGTSFADFSSGQVYNNMLRSVQEDPRFAGLDKLNIEIVPPSMKMSLSARIANGLGIFPLSFNLT